MKWYMSACTVEDKNDGNDNEVDDDDDGGYYNDDDDDNDSQNVKLTLWILYFIFHVLS